MSDNIFSRIFGGSTTTVVPANNPQVVPVNQTQPAPAVTTAVTDANNVATNPQNPLDFLMSMRNTDPNGQVGQAPSLSIPQETLATVAKSIDYSKSIPQEALAQLQSGDLSALPNILNAVLQQQYQTIMQHQSAVTDKFVADRSAYDQTQLQRDMRANIVDSSLRIKDMHPMAQDMFRSTAKNLASKFPEATPQDIEEQTWAIMESLGGQFNRTQQQQIVQQKAADVDWDKFGEF